MSRPQELPAQRCLHCVLYTVQGPSGTPWVAWTLLPPGTTNLRALGPSLATLAFSIPSCTFRH